MKWVSLCQDEIINKNNAPQLPGAFIRGLQNQAHRKQIFTTPTCTLKGGRTQLQRQKKGSSSWARSCVKVTGEPEMAVERLPRGLPCCPGQDAQGHLAVRSQGLRGSPEHPASTVPLNASRFQNVFLLGSSHLHVPPLGDGRGRTEGEPHAERRSLSSPRQHPPREQCADPISREASQAPSEGNDLPRIPHSGVSAQSGVLENKSH